MMLNRFKSRRKKLSEYITTYVKKVVVITKMFEAKHAEIKSENIRKSRRNFGISVQSSVSRKTRLFIKTVTRTNIIPYHKRRGDVMQKIEVVPRICIDGIYHYIRDLPKEKIDAIIEQRIDLGMSGANFERKKTA